MQTGTEEANGSGLAAPSGLPANFHPSTIRTLRRLLTKESSRIDAASVWNCAWWEEVTQGSRRHARRFDRADY